MANSRGGKGHKDKYLDPSRNILSHEILELQGHKKQINYLYLNTPPPIHKIKIAHLSITLKF